MECGNPIKTASHHGGTVQLDGKPAYSPYTGDIQPSYRSRTGGVQVKTGPIQVNTAKYGSQAKPGLFGPNYLDVL
jgi:hypothetical protein